MKLFRNKMRFRYRSGWRRGVRSPPQASIVIMLISGRLRDLAIVIPDHCTSGQYVDLSRSCASVPPPHFIDTISVWCCGRRKGVCPHGSRLGATQHAGAHFYANYTHRKATLTVFAFCNTRARTRPF